MNWGRLALFLAVCFAFVLGLAVKTWLWKPDSGVEADLLAEQIDEVFKLVTVEGRFSEIYKYSDYWGYDLSPLRKKALIRVSARVSVGLDLEQARVELDERGPHPLVAGGVQPGRLAAHRG